MRRLLPVLRWAAAVRECINPLNPFNPWHINCPRIERVSGMTRYPLFRYDSFAIDKSPSRITARFKFSIPPDIAFTPEVHFESVPDGWHSVPKEFLNNAVFHLGLIES